MATTGKDIAASIRERIEEFTPAEAVANVGVVAEVGDGPRSPGG